MAPNVSSASSRDALAFVNGLVYTVNQLHSWAEAFIVSPEGMFTSVGSTKDIRGQAETDDLVIYDLKGQFVMPGIHDAHMHILYAGLTLLSENDLGMGTTGANVAERVAEKSCGCAYAHVHGEWLLNNALSVQDFDRSNLDHDFPDTPVYIQAGAGHNMYANTALLKRAGYDVEQEPDSHAARFVRREDGSLTGELSELAMNKAALALPKPAISHCKRALKAAIKQAHKVGVTSLQEPSGNTALMTALSELEKEYALKMDCYTHLVDAPEYLGGEPRSDLHALIESADKFESEHVHTSFVKFMLDGVPIPPMLTHCGLDEHGNPDESKIAVPDLAERILEHDRKGRTVKVHCTGRGSTRKALDAIEQARKQNSKGPKHEIAHSNSVDDVDFPRFSKLGVTAEMSPAFFFNQPMGSTPEDLKDWEWDFNKFMEYGSHITVGSDWSGIFDPSLLPHLAGRVEKVGSGSKERGGELLCRMITLAGAEAVRSHDETGSIEVGKKANFIAVSKNLAKGQFEDAKVMKTWFEGELVWDSNER